MEPEVSVAETISMMEAESPGEDRSGCLTNVVGVVSERFDRIDCASEDMLGAVGAAGVKGAMPGVGASVSVVCRLRDARVGDWVSEGFCCC